jgi:hypothetical protein
MCEPLKPRNTGPRETDCGINGSAEPLRSRRRPMTTWLLWNLSMSELPGVIEDGMSGRNVQRKPGTARGSPRRSRTAKASRISRRAVKSRCACERGGWGRLSVDGPGHYNPDRSEDLWGRWNIHLMAVHWVHRPADWRGDLRPRRARRAKTNRSSVSACREQA